MAPLAVNAQVLENYFRSDIQFNLLYPASIQHLARQHWTPLNISKMASDYLATEEGVKILDIGSGVGKFCLSAAYYKPRTFFEGIEQRIGLVEHAESVRNLLGLKNASFVHGNFTQLNFKKYDHFYFYNSFFENLVGTDKIDDSIQYSSALYNYYSAYLNKELDKKPAGTRIVTYCSWDDEIPPSYYIVNSGLDGLLKFFIKA